ncbi:MAG: glucose-6-phosphate isomerase [Candidatus Omnitrophota bacterium]
MKKPKITLDTKNIEPFVSKKEIDLILPEIAVADEKIKKGTGYGAEFLGWLHIGSTIGEKLISDIENTAVDIRRNSDILLCIGIGGSYLGSRAGIEFLSKPFRDCYKNKDLSVHFCGNNLSSDYLASLLDIIDTGKSLYVNVISKSGTTIEPALAFRVVYDFMKKRYSKKEIAKRVICTTDQKKGALKNLAIKERFKTFVIPDNIGGRFSVLSPVGLFPMACAGIDIKELLSGVADFEKYVFDSRPEENIAYQYAGIRNLLYRSGKQIEILAGFHPSLHYLLEWWKQLFAESEGKDSKGIFPAIVDFTQDLHSLGQLIQQGERNIFETFMVVNKSFSRLAIPRFKDDIDNLNYIAGKDLDWVNTQAYLGTIAAHIEGGVPNMSIQIPQRSAYYLGQIYYFFEVAVAVSGYLLNINPFDQPGVEAYKQNMYRLLKKQV